MPAAISALADGAHVVQFYTDDAVLVDVISSMVGCALVAGDSAVVIASADHETALRRSLADRGLDVSVALRQGRYIPLNAADLLRTVMHNGMLDTEAFRATALAAILRARSASESEPQRVAVFGEAVDLLVKDDFMAPALALERLWNELIATEAFALCCGYDMDSFRGGRPTAPFLHVCSHHSQVFPAERRSSNRFMRPRQALRH